MEEITCDNCNQPLRQIEKLETKPRGKFKKKYRIRRFFCDLCEIPKTVFATGYRDSQVEPENAIDEVKKLYEQENEARNQPK